MGNGTAKKNVLDKSEGWELTWLTRKGVAAVKERTEVLGGRFTPRERKIVVRVAKKNGMTESQYVRAAVLSSCVLDGDVEAMRVTGGYLVKHLAEKAGRLIREGEVQLSPA